MKSAVVVVLGNIHPQQYESVKLALLKLGMKPKITRVDRETLGAASEPDYFVLDVATLAVATGISEYEFWEDEDGSEPLVSPFEIASQLFEEATQCCMGNVEVVISYDGGDDLYELFGPLVVYVDPFDEKSVEDYVELLRLPTHKR